MSRFTLNTLFVVVLSIVSFMQLSTSDVVLAQADESVSASEFASPQIGAIVISGNKKIETDAIMARLLSKVGSRVDKQKIREEIQALFRTGYFYDVQVTHTPPAPSASTSESTSSSTPSSSSVTLIYKVVEKPSVIEIRMEGQSEIEADELKEAAGLKSFEILNESKLHEATEKMLKLYEDKGYFLARVTPHVEAVVAGESVRVRFQIEENAKVKVKRIHFLGNNNLGEQKLKSVMQTQEGGFFSSIGLSDSGAYKPDAFDRDIQVLQYYYRNEGYIQVRIDKPQVTVTPDKTGIYITIHVDEGRRFRIGKVNFSGDLLFGDDELYQSIEIDDSEWYSQETILRDIKSLQAKYGDLGYAYANPVPQPHIQEEGETPKVDITFDLDKGNKVYFGRINFIGNMTTRDKVLRRELRIHEGELYNETRKRESLANLQRLGFFEEGIAFNPRVPPDQSDVMNVDIVVKERNTGQLNVGFGWGTYTSFMFNGQVNQANLFGRGQMLGLSVNITNGPSRFDLQFVDPYFFDTKWTFEVNAYQSRNPRNEFTETKKGGRIQFGHPIYSFLNTYLAYKLDKTEIDLSADADPALFPINDPSRVPARGWTSSAELTFEVDRRNDRLFPTHGYYSSASYEHAGIGGGKSYSIFRANTRYYQKLFWQFIFRNNLVYSSIRANDPHKDPPYNELFLLGGDKSLRGYNYSSVGKTVHSEKAKNAWLARKVSPDEAEARSKVPFGGKQRLYYQGEIEFPLVSEAGIKGVTFFDIGGAPDDFTWSDIKSDVGFGFRILTPIAPFRFEWGFPINRSPYEDPFAFSFSMGSSF